MNIQLWLSNGRNALTYLYTLYVKYTLRCGTPLLADSSLISSRWARDLFVHWEASEIRPRGLWRRLLDCGLRKRPRQESYLITMGRWKRRAGPVLYDFNASRHIFGTKLIKGIIFQNLIFHSLRSTFITVLFYILFYYFVTRLRVFLKYGKILRQFTLKQ